MKETAGYLYICRALLQCFAEGRVFCFLPVHTLGQPFAKIKQGDYVETSGYSSVFPPGIFVGRISHLGTSADGQTYDVVVNLGIDFANLRDVSIVTTPYKAEIDTLRSHAAEADAAFDEAG